MDVVVTAVGQVYTQRDAITYDPYFATASCYPSPDSNFIYIEGRNFGAYDATLNRKVGDFGCESSDWISDTAARCVLLPGKVASDVTIEAIESMAMCGICQAPEVLDGCIQGISPGNCDVCQSCEAGKQRAGCVIGGFTRGYCETCRTGSDYEPSDRTYKSEIGRAHV